MALTPEQFSEEQYLLHVRHQMLLTWIASVRSESWGRILSGREEVWQCEQYVGFRQISDVLCTKQETFVQLNTYLILVDVLCCVSLRCPGTETAVLLLNAETKSDSAIGMVILFLFSCYFFWYALASWLNRPTESLVWSYSLGTCTPWIQRYFWAFIKWNFCFCCNPCTLWAWYPLLSTLQYCCFLFPDVPSWWASTCLMLK